ncbi:hypothetical protein COV17_03905 [Candidatus Woesearchaeota archaeon CG10_big_fil_rev_8_21_14_0_10_36_11]|nr:MAG: hypothetical protein COV17_03905 [Candidatus Woesearchaeota archaeon CG10_big_fil_rev_8_21_14_0_10_36_11]
MEKNYSSHSMKCVGLTKIIIGILILLNAFVWPMWLGIDGWVAFFAVLMILLGLGKLFHPCCSSSSCAVPEVTKMPARKRKRR